MNGWLRDLRYALRMLSRAPGFTTVAVLTLGLGIGANTAMFAVVNAVLLKPLPFEQADRLMLVHLLVPDRTRPGVFGALPEWSYPKYRSFTEMQEVFEDAAFFSGRDVDVTGGGAPERVRGEVVSDRYPDVLGLGAALGRTFTHDEAHRKGAARVAMIGHGLWLRRFGGDPAVVGGGIDLNGARFTIVGVLPRGFRGLTGNADVFVPLAAIEPAQLDQAQSHAYTVVARRRARVSEAEAMAAVRLLGPRIDAAHRDANSSGAPWGAIAVSLNASRADVDIRRASLLLFGAVAFVLLIACVNLTNLLVARGLGREREVAVRLALGASRGHVLRQFLAEGLVLSVLAAAAGVGIAAAVLAAAGALLPDPDVFFRSAIAPGVPRTAGAAGLTRIGAGAIHLDLAAMLFTSGVALVTVLLVSLFPAIVASSLRPIHALRARGIRPGRRLRWLDGRAVLVAAQIGLALVLLAGAGLMIRSARHLRAIDLGISHRNIVTVRLSLPRTTYTSQTGSALFTTLLDRTRALPGVDSAALGTCPPLSGGCSATIMWFPPAGPRRDGRDPVVGIQWVSPEYFSTLGIRVLQGRTFTDPDREGQPKVLIVNEAAARAIWPDGTPLGRRVAIGMGSFGSGADVVGVVADVRYRALESAVMPEVYAPLAQSYQPGARLFVRSALDASRVVAAVTRELHALDANLPLGEIKTMDERVRDAMWRTRVSVWLLAAFAGLALLLTAIGVFGVMAQAVAQRTPEIGVRMALGAQPRDVVTLVLRKAGLVIATGVAIGAAGALGLTRVMTSLLYGVQGGDPVTLMAAAALLAGGAFAAGYVPARRAVSVDPVTALRAE